MEDDIVEIIRTQLILASYKRHNLLLNAMDQTKKTGIGSTIGTIIIIALIVLGGLYFWGKRLEENKNIQRITSEASQSATTTATDTNNSGLGSSTATTTKTQ